MRQVQGQVTAMRAVEAAPSVRLALLGGFELRHGKAPILLAAGPQRVIAFVALHARPLRRGFVSGSLWPDATEARAAASLRSALWRVQRHVPLLLTIGDKLGLAGNVSVDLHEAAAAAECLVDAPKLELPGIDRSLLTLELLPGWYDDWVLIERERWRQLRLHALEVQCSLLATAGRFGEALEVGLEALAGDPLRESAHRALVRVHLAEGNVGEARRQYRLCEALLRDELGVAPSESMQELVAGAVA